MILVEAIAGMLRLSWDMIMMVKFPGSDIPIGVIIVGAFVIGFGIRILAYVLGMGVNVESAVDKHPNSVSSRLKADKAKKLKGQL